MFFRYCEPDTLAWKHPQNGERDNILCGMFCLRISSYVLPILDWYWWELCANCN